jgi:hypothetical protein
MAVWASEASWIFPFMFLSRDPWLRNQRSIVLFLHLYDYFKLKIIPTTWNYVRSAQMQSTSRVSQTVATLFDLIKDRY